MMITKDTFRFRFEFAPKKMRCYFGLPAGQHIRIFGPNTHGKGKEQWNNKPNVEKDLNKISRKYTPVTPDSIYNFGYVDFIVKIYKPLQPIYPDGGKLSAYLDSLAIGDLIEIQGPVGHSIYHGHGKFTTKGRELTPRKYVAMIAGGTGITPMLQVLYKSFLDSTDTTSFWLIYANRSPEDIIERNLFDDFTQFYTDRFHCWYVVDAVTSDPEMVEIQQIATESILQKKVLEHQGIDSLQEEMTNGMKNLKQSVSKSNASLWKYSVGYITEEIIEEHIPKPSTDSVVLLCGPPIMTRDICKPILEKLGWSTDDLLYF